MPMFNCFSAAGAKKKKNQENKPVDADEYYEKLKTLQVKSERQTKPITTDKSRLLSNKHSIDCIFNMKVMNHKSPKEGGSPKEGEVAYQEEQKLKSSENYNTSMIPRIESNNSFSNTSDNSPFGHKTYKDEEEDFGYESDPGIGKQEFWASPKLVRSCSFVEASELFNKVAYKLPSFEDKSCDEMSPMSHHSVDKMMMKKHSLTQILPSRSKKLWRKLFLWNHRNMSRPSSEVSKTRSLPTSMSNQEFPRVDHWVQELVNEPILYTIDDYDGEKNDGTIEYPPSPKTRRLTSRDMSLPNRRANASDENIHANSAIQSLNMSSSAAHIIGVGLKVMPKLSHFSNLRSVNLCGNLIAHITPGCLPKGLHTLDLSRNKITAIEGLRELTRLRVLDLSYNKISRVEKGLSNCTLIRELYLVGNKINEVEGLHRLLKLNVLDLSFNKIGTTKALRQLVANFNSLLAVNLLGNPIEKNISQDKLRKAVSSLLPKLAFFNKQPLNSQKAKEVACQSTVKAALGNRNNKRIERSLSMARSGCGAGRRGNTSILRAKVRDVPK